MRGCPILTFLWLGWGFFRSTIHFPYAPASRATALVSVQSFRSNNDRGRKCVAYDAASNMTDDGSHTYVYDAENRVVSMDSGAWTFVYNALGQRVEKVN